MINWNIYHFKNNLLMQIGEMENWMQILAKAVCIHLRRCEPNTSRRYRSNSVNVWALRPWWVTSLGEGQFWIQNLQLEPVKQFNDVFNFVLMLNWWGSPHCVVANVFNCNIIESKFELQSYYYIHFWTNTLGKCTNSFILPAMD